ncbi:MAG: flagellar biosynthesis protein FlhF [Pseudacidovorax sp.]|nr:flagellar biosynthesis protein FlhF [Pseudacidovorax sp.]
MNIQRFLAPTAREAMAMARAAFGDDALILSNKQTEQGVEVMAASEESLAGLQEAATARPAAASAPAAPVTPAAAAFVPPRTPNLAETSVEEDANHLAMSTLSFQDFVRERMLRKQLGDAAMSAAALPASPAEMAAPLQTAVTRAAAPVAAMPWNPAAAQRPAPLTGMPLSAQRPAVAAVAEPAPAGAMVPAQALSEVMAELRALRQMVETRFEALSWLGRARQDPALADLMLRLVRAGFSAPLVRAVLQPIAAGTDAATAEAHVLATFTRLLAIDEQAVPLEDEGGILALVGPTGVGKTTAIAKLATLCARNHGAASVGLITLDTQRAGAHEQLRAFGRSIDVVAHQAHDTAALQELLALLAHKRLVLIDTAGHASHDPRRQQQMAQLDLPGVKPLVVLNAGAQGDALDEVAQAFREDGARHALLTKVDEAVKLGPALDVLMRHGLQLRGLGCGQVVPDDWRMPRTAELLRETFNAPLRGAFEPRCVDDLDLLLSPAQCSTRR